MDRHLIKIEVRDGELENILNRLTKAQEEVYECYNELKNLGVVTIKKEPSNEN